MQRLRSPFVIAALVGVTALLGLLVYGLSHNGPDRAIDDSLAKGQREAAPDFDLPRLEGGGRQTLADYRGQGRGAERVGLVVRPVPHRVAAAGALAQAHLPRTARARCWASTCWTTRPTRKAFIREYGLTYPQLKDPEDELRPEYGVAGVPETIVIDARGRVAAVKRGPVDDAFMRRNVAPLLKAGA